MYQVGKPKMVFDPYEYIPSYGESDIELNFKSNVLVLNIIFDNEETNKEACLKIVFENAFFYKIESYPGVKGMNCSYDYGNSLSSLIEFSESEYKVAWEEHFKGLFQLSHYKMFFLNANKSIEVICEGFQIEKVFLK